MSKTNDSPTVLELLKQKDKVEALNWLTSAPRGVHRNVGELTGEESVQYLRNLYELGVLEILAVKIGVKRQGRVDRHAHCYLAHRT